MGNKKDIGKILNEQLSNLSKSPHDKVWVNIEAELKKSKRRILPFWFWILGAGLLISTSSILIYNHYISLKNEQTNPSIVNDKNVDDKNLDYYVNQKTNELIKSQNDSTTNTSLTSTKNNSLLNRTQENQYKQTNTTNSRPNTSNNTYNAINNSFNTNPIRNNLNDNESNLRDYSKNLNSILFLEGYPVVFIKTHIDTKIQFKQNFVC